ncbi:acyl carrier protein [Thalassospira marina]|nr:acyl carrier protein [Thalassospira marina]
MNRILPEKNIDEAAIFQWLQTYICKTLDMNPASVGLHDNLDSLGMDSAITTALAMDLEGWLNIEIPLSILFEADSLEQIAAGVSAEINRQQVSVE